MLFLSCFVMLLRTSVCLCLVGTCWERADILKKSMQLLNVSLQLPVSLVLPYNKGCPYQMGLTIN